MINSCFSIVIFYLMTLTLLTGKKIDFFFLKYLMMKLKYMDSAVECGKSTGGTSVVFSELHDYQSKKNPRTRYRDQQLNIDSHVLISFTLCDKRGATVKSQ